MADAVDWGDDDLTQEASRPQHPPAFLLALAALAVAIGAVALLLHGIEAKVVGYSASSLVAIFLIAAYRRRDAVLRQGLYVPRDGLNLFGTCLGVGGLAVSAAHSWQIATYLATSS